MGKRRVGQNWLNALIFTLALVGLVAAAIGADWQFTLAALALSGVGFGFFFFAIPGGPHFGVAVANFVAVYACVFVFFRDANFSGSPPWASLIALPMPVAAFLAACLARRRRIAVAIHARRLRELQHLPRLTRWLPAMLMVGCASFALPEIGLGRTGQATALLASMALISAIAAAGVGDIVLLLMDIALIFEAVAARLNRLVMPIMAFLTVYTLVIVVFGCLYRIADLTTGETQFTIHGHPHAMSFIEAIYFSLITLATVGYGDFAPAGALVRVLAGFEVVAGVLLLLFGVSEIMRSGGPDSERRAQRRPLPRGHLDQDIAESRGEHERTAG